MNKQNQRNKKSAQGFTIIEVVLVLAIAALIFLMVFIALPALQRGQRDTGRKNDVSTAVSALQTYLSNNRGNFTSINTTTFQKYIDRLSQYEPTDVVVNPPATTADTKKIYVYTLATCPASINAPGTLTYTVGSGGPRQAAVFTALENSGTGKEQVFCQNL